MAYNHVSALFFIALLVFVVGNLSAHAITLGGLTLGGQLCCTSTGNCPGQGVGGVAVLLNCTSILGRTTTVGQTTTSATGSFNITVPPFAGLILGLHIIPCRISVRLPLDAAVCPVLSTTTGVLASTLQSVGTVVTTALGLVQNATLTGFTILPRN